ncbi:MAG: hypothetical protein HY686_07630 [Chloroflexi bacterium]|nr:hypothetical protein [Chloroflexota bacterium]
MSQLRRAAQEALAYLHTQPDVQEAEVFAASNGSLFARLNYTSHIPSNGVEEPKSLESCGVALRVAFKAAEGVRLGFGSEPSDITLEGIERALAKARRAAVHDPGFVSLPRPTGEKRTLTRYHDPLLMRMRDNDLLSVGWLPLEGALETFQSSEDLLTAAGSPDGLARLGLIVGGDVTVLQERIAIASTAMPKVQADQSTLIMGFITGMVEQKSAKGTGWQVGTRLAEFSQGSGVEAARNAIRSMDGVRVPDGEYRVVLGPQAVTELLNFIIVPSLLLDTVYAGASPFCGKLTKSVAAEALSIYDHGALPGFAASKGITCEGVPTGRTDLIRRGVLVGLLTNSYRSQQVLHDPRAREMLGVDPQEHRDALVPRNGFRFAHGGGRHITSPPGIFGTNVIVDGPAPCSHEELLRRVREGLYIGRIWYTYPINGLAAGDFTSTVVGDSFRIRDGRLAEPIKANSIRINDSIHRLLQGVTAVGRETRGTVVWAADQIAYTPEVAVAKLAVKEIAGYMEAVYPSR